ncbi:MAG: AAA family ATPase [Candidatus Pacearchaeota archaeon]|nr:MAG: AAA family ATPase [Candidatus Pacearchaeota archaeon]
MIIKKIELHNIRSYLDETITLPKGKVLLSGDIGSGKSTVLFAIEFALFGLQRGIMDGSSILRNGKKEGYVELEISIGKHEIMIRRNLKRSKNSVAQSNAILMVDGKKKELTATELKSFILGILNYPSSLLKKKNLIYRYTVYTPQEEMKRIMLEENESRLDTLRKVFDIDKYKRILNNSEIFVSEIKEKKKEKEGRLIDLPFKKEQLKKKIESGKDLVRKVEITKPSLSKLQQKIRDLKDKLKEEQKNIDILNKTKIKITGIETELKEKNTKLQELEKEEQELDKTIKQFKSEIKSPVKKNLAKIKFENEILLKNGRDNEKIIDRQITMLTVKKEKFLEDLGRISKLKFCPVCKQKVESSHRDHIVTDINQELEKIEKELQRKKPSLEELKKDIEKIESELKKIAEEEKKALTLELKLKELQERGVRKLKISNSKTDIRKKISGLEKIKEFETEMIKKYKNMEKEHEKTLEILEDMQRKEKILLMEKAGFEQGLADIKQEISEIKKEIWDKEKVAQKLIELQKFENFLTENFSVVVEMMEKQVMLKLNAEFNALFRKWFMMLVDDPNLDARIDPEFTPIIEQGGYEINYNYLSGGEKTALALAYRLSLNQVINSMLSKIKTRNLLILDEPTDGFSTEQLDKMRNVLHELKTEQLILVSHESKVESFVEHVINFKKQNHISHVV